MKKLLSLFAVILLCATLLSSCNFGEGSDTTTPDGTTAEVSTNGNTSDNTTTPVVITPPDTTPPKDTDVLRVLAQEGTSESLTSFFAEDEQIGALLDRRLESMLAVYSATVTESRCSSIVTKIKAEALSLSSEYDLLLLNATDAFHLLCQALLEDVGEAGIEIDENCAGIDSDILSSLSIGGKNYLFTTPALSSTLYSSYALKYRGGYSAFADEAARYAKEGEFTNEYFLSLISEIESSSDSALGFTIQNERENVFAYLSLGGKLYSKNTYSLPKSALSSNAFSSPYSAALALVDANSSAVDSAFVLSQLLDVAGEEFYLPVPKLDGTSEYITPIDAKTLLYFASPLGVSNGARLRRLVTALSSSSAEYASSAVDGVKGSHKDADALLEIIEKNRVLDLGLFFGWGDLDELVSSGLETGKNSSSFFSERTLAERNETVSAAVKIIAERLDIKEK